MDEARVGDGGVGPCHAPGTGLGHPHGNQGCNDQFKVTESQSEEVSWKAPWWSNALCFFCLVPSISLGSGK